MHKNNLLSSERRQKILEFVTEKRSVSVDELTALFPVSAITVRRDLDRLSEAGLLRRVHGGAMALSNIVIAPRASEMSSHLTEDQKRIGKEGSTRIADGDFLIIESGSTCIALVNSLNEKKQLKVVSVSPRIIMLLADMSEKYNSDFEIISSGGILNVYKNFFIGPHAMNLLGEITVDIAFISVTAIDLESGITADNVYEAEISRMILQRCAKKKIGLVYSSKFGKVSFVKVAPVEVLDEIISDMHLPPDIAAQYTERGIKMTLV